MMAPRPLASPRSSLASQELALRQVEPARLIRVSGHDSGEPYFGRSGANRFDDPELDPARRYGTCYFGYTLAVAVAETLLHDDAPVNGHFLIAADRIATRFVVSYAGTALILADLTGPALKRLGLDAGLSGTPSYRKTQKWSRAIHDHPSAVDGFVYMSRHLNTGKAVVLFDRARAKIRMVGAQPLSRHPAFRRVMMQLGIEAA